jgi:preprotein translocase subunit YajC
MWSLFEGTAWAQATGVAAGAQGSEYGTLIQMAPIVGIIAIFYFLIIRPQTQKASEHTKMLGGLKKNDEVVTNGGLIGRITELGEKVVTIEVAPNVKIRVERAQVMGLSSYGKTAATKS